MFSTYSPQEDSHDLFSELLRDNPVVDLSRLGPTLPAEPPPAEAPELEDSLELKTASRKRPTSPSQSRRDHHNTHTRRCRARLNWRFDALHAMLPSLPGKEIPRHKVHVLDHAISALTALRAENDNLRFQVALRSPSDIARWVDDVVARSGDSKEALACVLQLLCYQGRWCYAEVWAMCEGGIKVERALMRCSAVSEKAFSDVQRHADGYVAMMELEFAGRAFLAGCAQWERDCVLACLDAKRVEMLLGAKVRTGLAVPVPVDGESGYVVALYDVRERKEDCKVVDFATFVAAAFGNCIGARRFSSTGEVGSRVGVAV